MASVRNTGILETVKAMIGGVVEYSDDTFDTELIVDINTVLSTLNQIGIGKQDFVVTYDETWAEFFDDGEDDPKYQQVKTYVYLKVRQLFDPPSSSIIANALDAQIKEIEWRLHNLANY